MDLHVAERKLKSAEAAHLCYDLMILWQRGSNHKPEKTKWIRTTAAVRRGRRNVETLLITYSILDIFSSFSIYQTEASNATL